MNEYVFAELEVGKKESFCVQIKEDMEDMFRELTGDINPLHRYDDFARKIGGGRFGMLTASFYSTLAGVYLPGRNSLIHSLEVKFLHPVYAGDQLTVMGEVVDRQEELGLILVKASITNQKGQKVSKATIKILVMEEEE